jgi:hypothetical protein
MIVGLPITRAGPALRADRRVDTWVQHAVPLPILLSRDTMPRRSPPLWPKRIVILGSVLIVIATTVGAISTASAELSSALGNLVPAALLTAVIGAVLVLVGTIRWAFDLPPQKLFSSGVALLFISFVVFVIINRITFGFDDTNILFAQLVFYLPAIIGVICLVFAAARRSS